MSDQTKPGSPEQQNSDANGIPHSGAHGEKNVHDYRNPNGSTMSIEQAVAAGKFTKPDGTPYTVEEILHAPLPIGIIPNIEDYSDPANSPRTEAFTPLSTPETKRKSRRNLIVGAVAGVAALATAAGFGAKALDNNGIAATPGPRPTATGPAVAGTTPSPSIEQPSKAPSASEAPTTPIDAEESLANEAKTELDKKLAERAPLYENPFKPSDFEQLVMKESTRGLFAKKYNYPNLAASQFPVNQPIYTGDDESQEHKRVLEVSHLMATQKALAGAFQDGSLEKAIAESNRLLGTDYKLSDFYIEESEIPRSNTDKAFLAKMIDVTHKFRTLSFAMKRAENNNTNGTDTGEMPLSQKLLEISHLSEDDWNYLTQANNELSKDIIVSQIPFEPDVVDPSTSLLDFSVGDKWDNGYISEAATKEGLKDLSVPLLGTIATTTINNVIVSPGKPMHNNRNKAEVMVWQTILPVTVDGKTVGVPVFVDQVRLGSK